MISISKQTRFRVPLIILFLFMLSLNLYYTVNSRNSNKVHDVRDFTGINNTMGFPYYIVPNIVHLMHFLDGNETKLDFLELNFIEVIAIKAASLNQKPDRIIIHCNCEGFRGKYWDMVKDIRELEVKFIERPTHIFGKKFNSVQHASDIARILVLQKYGGIYIDRDSYIVQSLDKYRKFEFTLGWPLGAYLGTQVLVANRNARFLKMWYYSYHDYQPQKWYYNAGELPTKVILMAKPEIVHRVPRDFGVHDLKGMLYRNDTDEWRTFEAIHLLSRHLSPQEKRNVKGAFDEENIKAYNATFGRMARLVLYGTTNIISSQQTSTT